MQRQIVSPPHSHNEDKQEVDMHFDLNEDPKLKPEVDKNEFKLENQFEISEDSFTKRGSEKVRKAVAHHYDRKLSFKSW